MRFGPANRLTYDVSEKRSSRQSGGSMDAHDDAPADEIAWPSGPRAAAVQQWVDLLGAGLHPGTGLAAAGAAGAVAANVVHGVLVGLMVGRLDAAWADATLDELVDDVAARLRVTPAQERLELLRVAAYLRAGASAAPTTQDSDDGVPPRIP
jgi:hypothetical protein